MTTYSLYCEVDEPRREFRETPNVRCLGGGGRDRVEALAEAIARHEPDVVALQEVAASDEFVGLVGLVGRSLAARDLVGFHFGAPAEEARKRYGNVIASTGSVSATIRTETSPSSALDGVPCSTDAAR